MVLLRQREVLTNVDVKNHITYENIRFAPYRKVGIPLNIPKTMNV